MPANKKVKKVPPKPGVDYPVDGPIDHQAREALGLDEPETSEEEVSEEE